LRFYTHLRAFAGPYAHLVFDYSLHVNARRKQANASPSERDTQFGHIDEQKIDFLASGEPMISADTKKELIGNFKNAGRAWCLEPEAVLVHEFAQYAVGQVVPYCIYRLNDKMGVAVPWIKSFHTSDIRVT
jgi:Rhodopirellula transposase DDE domain